MTFCDYKDPFARVCIYGEYGYGHMVATIYNVIPEAYRCPIIRVSCQVGHGRDFATSDTQFEKPYAERWGIEGRDAELVGLDEMEMMIPLMRRIDKRLKRLDAEMGYPRSYAEYMFRILTAMKLNRVIYLEQFNARASGEWADMPHIEMGNSWSNNDLLRQLEKMQTELCSHFTRPIGEAA